MDIRVIDFRSSGAIEFTWPSRHVESFKHSWDGRLTIDDSEFAFRHALGERHVYGRPRVHSVTWVGGQVAVEGVEADDYVTSRALISLLKQGDRKHARTEDEVPALYTGIEIVRHSDEIKAPRSPNSLAAKIGEEDIGAWARHAAIRAALFERLPGVQIPHR